MNNLFDLTGKTALITGGGGLLGPKHAEAIVEYGGKVILTDWHEDRAKEKAERIGENATYHYMDVTDKESIEAVVEQYDKIDILINNAATNPFYGSVLAADEQAWDKTLNVNLKGPFFMSQHAAKLMRENGGGSIVNVSSINGRIPMHKQSIYSITKAGLISMTQAFAKELGLENIRVNALLPGLTDTKFASALTQNEELMKNVLQQIPLGRIAQPSEMSGMMLFLVSDAASYVTGSTFTVDGGVLA